ncbi:MAG TPA: helix-turn-helix transcriptional regulator [Pseudonocardiaceae bacterium]|nr:helix-turn-helix transcriptional regulator [Pseudonocardiaceae bacterium]
MADAAPETVTSIRKQVGILIRQARTDAKLTQTMLADELGLSQSTITNIESGKTRIAPGNLRKVIVACRVDEHTARELWDLVGNDQRGRMPRGQRALRTRAGSLEFVPQYFREFTELERTAAKIRAWHGERLPGLLQSEQYMLNLFKSNNRSDRTVSQLMIGRNQRKKVLSQDSPPLFQYLLGEGALRRMPGGPDSLIMLDQLEYLIKLIDTHERLAIYLVPFDAQLSYVPNDFTIMDFVDGTTNFVYIEYPGGGQHLEDREIYEACDQQWDELRGAALQRQDTRTEFVKLAKSYR